LVKQNCRIMVEERTPLKFSDFYMTKNGIIEPTCEQFQKWKQSVKQVKCVRLDNAGENKKLQKRCKSSDWKLGIKFDYSTACATLQQNSLSEVGFAMVANQGRALMARANIPMAVRYRIYSEAFKMAMLLDGLVTIELDGVTAMQYEHWCGKNPEFAKNLRTWGEAGTATVKTKMTLKVKDRGIQCMFVGYALDHLGDMYQMWDLETGGVHVSRDIIWMKRMFYEKKDKEESEVNPMEIDGVDNNVNVPHQVSAEVREGNTPENEEEEQENEEEEHRNVGKEDEDEPEEQLTTTRSGRTVIPRQHLIEEAGIVLGQGVGVSGKPYEIALTAAEINYY
jgi:hypothetical protein